MKRQVANIVFYKYFEGTEVVQKACIFYNDGTVEQGKTVAEGLKACEEVTARLNITSTDLFKSMINNKIVYAMSGAELKERFSSFIVNPTEKEETESKEVKAETEAEKIEELKKAAEEEAAKVQAEKLAAMKAAAEAKAKAEEEAAKKEAEEAEKQAKADAESDEAKEVAAKVAAIMAAKEAATAATEEAKAEDETAEEENKEEKEDDEVIEDGIEPKDDEEIEDKELLEKEETPKKEGFLKRLGKKIKGKVAALGLVLTATAIALTGCTARNLKTKEGKMERSNLSVSDEFIGPKNMPSTLYTGNNDDYKDYSVEELLAVTNDKTQKDAMSSARDAIKLYNGEFANAYIEEGKVTSEGKSIKPALTFDEIIALQQAYNDYSKEEIRAIFNGKEVNRDDMSRAYKDASLQLMGAYTIENAEHPVDMSMLIESKEGKEFYKKYHDMFLAAKSATTYEEKSAKVSEFYKAVREDFPITTEVRTEGISHAENYKKITSYKLAVTPMIAAAEMMYQNLETDVTLNDSEIDFLNDIGLCNYADDKFEKIETITLSSYEDKTNPSFDQFKNIIIADQLANFEYGIEDERRDLSQLDSFQNAVNWHFLIVGEGTYEESSSTKTSSYTYTKSSTSYRTEETRTEKPITPEAKKEIDDKIAAENADAKAKAEAEAAEKGKQLQADADKEKEKLEKEVAEDAAD